MTNQQNPARYRATMMRYRFGICVILGLLAMLFGGAAAGTEENGPWIATARLIRNGAPSGSGVYLGSGLIVTAAHLVDPNSPMSATVARVTLPATILKHGSEIDLSLLKIDKDKLPANPPLPDMPLCQAPPWPGDPVIVADATAITKSRIASPQGLNFLCGPVFHFDQRCCHHGKFGIRRFRSGAEMPTRHHERQTYGHFGSGSEGRREVFCSSRKGSQLRKQCR